jgi:hypothetical protein
MSDDRKPERSEVEAAIEREIREGRKFTLEEAIGRMAGPGAMKGTSPVPRLQQAETEIYTWLSGQLTGPGGLDVVLHRAIKESAVLLQHVDQPLTALAVFCRGILDSDELLKELVRRADVEWGRIMDERPFFEKEGRPPHPDDPYTVESVRAILSRLLEQLPADTSR